MMRRTVLSSLLLCGLLAGCLSPDPGSVESPDQQLTALLSDLRRLRGGDFSTTDENASAAGKVVHAIRRLSFTYPHHVPALVANAALARELKDETTAQKYLDQALARDAGHVFANILRAQLFAEEGNLSGARQRLELALATAPNSPDLREAYAGILYLDGDLDRAEEELRWVERLRPDERNHWRIAFNRGLIAEARNDLDVAREFYRQSQELRPEYEAANRRWNWLDELTASP